MSDVQWIKIKVGMFDGESFKKIKKAKIGGESFRDKLTAVWFELMDFAGKCNHSGFFISSREIPYRSIADIAVMIDREPEELELCMRFFINEGMVEIIDDVYLLSNWMMYQNEEKLERIREQTRLRVAKYRALKAGKDAEGDVTQDGVTDTVTKSLPAYSYSYSNSKKKDKGKEGTGGKGKEKPQKQMVSEAEFEDAIKSFPSSIQEILRDWFAYKTERKEGYTPRGLKSLMTTVRKNVEEYGERLVVEVIESSMSSMYVGIVWDKLKKYKPVVEQKALNRDDYGSPMDFYK